MRLEQVFDMFDDVLELIKQISIKRYSQEEYREIVQVIYLANVKKLRERVDNESRKRYRN
tara:strand:- start:116 stop:295 length:180 start_codon:yes stop_codon:yes gene_type:complete